MVRGILVWGQRAQEDVGDLLHRTGYPQRCLHLSRFWQPLKLCDTYLTSCQLRPGGNLRGKYVAERTTSSKQNRNFRPKGEGRSGHRPLLPKRKLNILVDLTLGKSYHSVVTFLHAQKIKCHTFSIQTSSKLISYYVCPWKVGP